MSANPDALTTAADRPLLAAAPRRPWTVWCTALTFGLVLYLSTMAPGVLWQDSGMAQVRVLQRDLYGRLGLALSHPLYYLIAFGFQFLPLGESAFKTNLVSAVFGAITIANVALVLSRLGAGYIGILVGTMSLAVAHTFWQHCALAEVYTLTTALLSLELILAVHYVKTGQAPWLVLLFFVNGLGISNHMLASLSGMCWAGWAAWLLARRRVQVRILITAAAAWAAGASLYLTLIAATALRTGDALGAIESALFGEYQRAVLRLLPTTKLLVRSLLYLGLNYPTPVVLLALAGLASIRRGPDRTIRSLIAILLGVTLTWAIRYDVPDQYTFFIPSLLYLSVLIGLGADHFLRRRFSGVWGPALIAGAALPVLVYGFLPEFARGGRLSIGVSREVPFRDAYTYFLLPWKRGYHGAEQFAEQVRETLPPNAVLLADGTTVVPIHYFQLTHRWRDDLEVYPPLNRAASARFTEEALRPALDAGRVFVVTPEPPYCPKWLVDRYQLERGTLVYRVISASAAPTRP